MNQIDSIASEAVLRAQLIARNLLLPWIEWHMKKKVVTCDPQIMSGTPVFAGTRVPVRVLMDHLDAGASIDDFLEGFPSVKREQVIAFLETAAKPFLTAELKPA
jgi:uncharacterized protein (DUF433 family)